MKYYRMTFDNGPFEAFVPDLADFEELELLEQYFELMLRGIRRRTMEKVLLSEPVLAELSEKIGALNPEQEV